MSRLPTKPKSSRATLVRHSVLLPGVEVTDKTVKLPPHISEVLNSAPHPIGSPVKGSRQLCCRGVELKPISYQLLALRCGHRSPVGNGFIRSVCHGFVGTSQSGNRKNCIGTSVKALLKKCRRHTAIIHYSLFIIHWGGHRPSLLPSPQAPQGEDNGVRCKIQQRTCVTRGSHGFARALDTGFTQSPYP